jgi:hypothetical protein
MAIEPADHGLGRSRDGLTSTIHLAVEQGQKPLSTGTVGADFTRLDEVETLAARVVASTLTWTSW